MKDFRRSGTKAMATAFFLLCYFITCCELSAQQKRLYIANDDHTDYMWTADEATYDSAFVQMLDFYLKQIDSTRNNPPDFQARFNCDGNYWLRAYEKYRLPAQFNRLMAAIRSGHISAPLNMLVSCYGAQPTEAVIRGMYYAGSLERRHRLRFTMASSMENNTLPLGLASLWAGAGARYSWKGIGGYGSQLSYEMRATRKHQLYRYTGLDSSSLIMKWYAYNEKKTAPLGGYAECRMKIKYVNLDAELGQVVNRIHDYCDTVHPASTYPYNVAAAFGFGHDDLQTFISNPFINAARNGTNASRKVRVSNEEDFFNDVEKTYPVLPSQSVSYGNEWDMLCASMNKTTALMRRATEKLRTAEALAALVSINDQTLMQSLVTPRNKAWESLGMYWEHNWTADGPVSRTARAAWQIKLQQQLSGYTDTLYNRSSALLSSQIKKSAPRSFYVFNPLSWTRNDVADVPYEGGTPVKVVDAGTKNEVASQLIIKDGKHAIRIMAENIPSVGYKVYEIRTEAPAMMPAAVSFDGTYLKNRFYRLRLNPSGSITDLYDSLSGRQLVTLINGKYLNDLGNSNSGDGDPLVVEHTGPVSVTIKAVSRTPVLHSVRVTMFANSARIDIENIIHQNFGDVKTWSFSFNLNNQITRHEELGAVLTVKKQSRGGHYADDNARYDYQTFNHFADMSEAAYGVTLSNMDCSFFKLGNSSVDSLWEGSSQLNALAGGNVDKKVEDGGILGILNQNRDTGFVYKFALVAHQTGFDPVSAMKFSLEHQNPLVTGMIDGTGNTLAGNSFSLLSVNDPEVLLWSAKPSEDGEGLVTRWWNMKPVAARPILSFAKPIRKAWKTSHIETEETVMQPVRNTLQLGFRSHQINTYKFTPVR